MVCFALGFLVTAEAGLAEAGLLPLVPGLLDLPVGGLLDLFVSVTPVAWRVTLCSPGFHVLLIICLSTLEPGLEV